MSKIQDALAKIQRGRQAGPPLPTQPLARVVDPDATVSTRVLHDYHGRQLQVDHEALQNAGLLVPDSQQRKLADEYRLIKRPLLTNARDADVNRGNLLMVASALAGEGKTFTCLNLCLSLAREKDWSVVLVDGDCQKPHLSRLFSAENEPGLLDYLRDKSLQFESLVMPTSIPGLSFLPAGHRDEHAAELLGSSRMADLVEYLANSDRGRLVVFDSSPLLMTTESPIIAAYVGQTVVVVRANHTPQQAVLTAIEKLDPSKRIALVLNQAEIGAESLAYGGAYGYGSYGQYGDG